MSSQKCNTVTPSIDPRAATLVTSRSAPFSNTESTPSHNAGVFSTESGSVRTVSGDVDPQQLGITLMHEHVYASIGDGYQLRDQSAAVRELKIFANAPFAPLATYRSRSLVELTSRGGRGDGRPAPLPKPYPEVLREVALASGVRIIMGSSYYTHSSGPIGLESKTIEEIEEEIVHDVTIGFEASDGTRIAAGIIGEVGVQESYFADPIEQKVAIASALAQLRTGAPLNFHVLPLDARSIESNRYVYQQLLILLEELGVDIRRVAFSHLMSSKDDKINELIASTAASGVNLEFDLFGTWRPEHRQPEDGYSIDRLLLRSRAYAAQVLISQDVCSDRHLREHGGPGYAELLNDPNAVFTFWTSSTGTRVVADGGRIWISDIDNDGYPDLVHQGAPGEVDAGFIYVARNNGAGDFQFWSWSSGRRVVADGGRIWIADVNNDGFPDILYQPPPGQSDSGFIYVALNDHAGGFRFWSWTTGMRVVADGGEIWIADVDGDGYADIVHQGAPGEVDAGFIYVALNDKTGKFKFWSWSTGQRVVADGGRIWIADVNNDGCPDIIHLGAPGNFDAGYIYVALNNREGGFTFWSSTTRTRVIADGGLVWIADVDGDGYPDIVHQGAPGEADAGYIYVALNNRAAGFGFWSSSTGTRVLADGGNLWIADVNNDGYPDIVHQGAPGQFDAGYIYVALNNKAAGFHFWSSNSGARVIADGGQLWLADVDGDGSPDIIHQGAPGEGDAGFVYVARRERRLFQADEHLETIMVSNPRKFLPLRPYTFTPGAVSRWTSDDGVVARNAVSRAAGIIGMSTEFDGVSAYLEVTYDKRYHLSFPFSLSMWLRTEGNGDGVRMTLVDMGLRNGRIIKDQSNVGISVQRGSALLLDEAGKPIWTIGTGSQWVERRSSTSLIDGRWHHLVLAYTGTELTVYTDGAIDTASELYNNGTPRGYGPVHEIPVNSRANYLIGCNAMMRDFFKGALDELVFYRGAVSESHVRQMYTARSL